MARIKSERISLPLWWRIILYFVGFILFALQILIFFFSIFYAYKGKIYFGLTYFISLFIGIIASLFILRKKMNANYKIIWCVLFLIFPIPFFTLYLFNYLSKLASSKSYKKNQYIYRNLDDNNALNSLKELDLNAYNIIKALKSQEPYTLYQNVCATYFPDAKIKHEDMLKELKNSKQYIYMEYFIISSGVLMNQIYDILNEKGKEGVEIKIIYDDLGSKGFFNRKLLKKLKRIPNLLLEPYGKVSPNLLVNYRDHRKICIIDGKIAYTGGDNLSDEYIHEKERFGYWRDIAIKLEGNIALSYEEMFLSTWSRIRGTKIENHLHQENAINDGTGYIMPIWDGPTNGNNPGYDMFCYLIESANKYIYISTPYFVIDDALIDLLVRKIKQGVDVRILMPSKPDKKTAFYMGRLNYRDIILSGGKVYEYKMGFNHAKSIIVDDKYAFIGTINMDYRSFFLHYECGALLMYNDQIIKMKEDYLKTLDSSELFDYKMWHKKKVIQRLIGYIFSLFAPLF